MFLLRKKVLTLCKKVLTSVKFQEVLVLWSNFSKTTSVSVRTHQISSFLHNPNEIYLPTHIFKPKPLKIPLILPVTMCYFVSANHCLKDVFGVFLVIRTEYGEIRSIARIPWFGNGNLTAKKVLLGWKMTKKDKYACFLICFLCSNFSRSIIRGLFWPTS